MGFDEPINYPPETPYLSPYEEETMRTCDGKVVRRIRNVIDGSSWVTTGYTGGYITTWDSTTVDSSFWRRFMDKEEVKKMEEVHTMHIHENGRFTVSCTDSNDLSKERILTSISAIKGKLMMDVSPVHVQRFECSMTPQVRANILQASKRLKMYGKKPPIIPRFDEYGFRLPDEITIDTLEGMSLKIIDPKDYGELYFELRAIEFPTVQYDPNPTWTYTDDSSIPF